MMFERFTPDARQVVADAQEHARRLGHRYVGTEHLLLAAVSPGEPASAVLREHGVTPERVEEEIVRQIGLGTGGDPLGGLDAEALASIGIDLDAVRARIETEFARAPSPGPARLRQRRGAAPAALSGQAPRVACASAGVTARPPPQRRLLALHGPASRAGCGPTLGLPTASQQSRPEPTGQQAGRRKLPDATAPPSRRRDTYRSPRAPGGACTRACTRRRPAATVRSARCI